MEKSDSIKNLAIALSKFQGEVKNPANTADNPFFKSKYAPLQDILTLVRPVLSKYGLSVVQAPSTSEGYVNITTTLIHESGEYIEFPPLSLKMDKVTAQGAGSAVTYSRRYSLSAILGISSEDDDDGNIAEEQSSKQQKSDSKPDTKALSEAQIKRLYAIANSAGISADTVKEQVKSKFKKDVKDLTKTEYDKVCNGYENLQKAKE